MTWYELPIHLQNQLRCAIWCAKYGAVLQMGPMNEFDFETASYVRKFRDFLFWFFSKSLPLFSIQSMNSVHFQLTKIIYRISMLLVTRFK